MDEALEQQQRQQAARMLAEQSKTRQASMERSVSEDRREMRDTLTSLRDVGAERADAVKDAVESVYGADSEEARAAANARTAEDDSVGRAKDAGEDVMRKIQDSLSATNDPDRKQQLEKSAADTHEAVDNFVRDVEAKSREVAGQVYGQQNVAETLNAAADAFRERERELEKELKDISPEQSLDVKYGEREYQTQEGEKRFESSAEALLRHDDDKLNPRHDRELKKEDAKLRKEVGGEGRDAAHLIACMFGAKPDERNLAAFNHVMNRSEMQKWEKETEVRRKAGEDLHVKVTAVFKADAEGKRADEPIAIRAERENRKTGERDSMEFGNFPSPATRAADQAREQDRQLTANERDRANQDSWAVNRQNQAAGIERQRDAGQDRGTPQLRLVQNDEDSARAGRERDVAEERRVDERRETEIDEERRGGEDRTREQQDERRESEARIRERVEQEGREGAREEEQRREVAEQQRREEEKQEQERREEARRREAAEREKREQERREQEREERRRDEERRRQ